MTHRPAARFGLLDLRAQGEVPSARRSDIHEEAFVKTGAGRLRDFPDIHSASAAQAARHERVCGCPHSHRRRRTAPCRTPVCNLSPALDPDVKPSSDRRTAHRGTPPATEKMASGGPGGGNESPVAGTEAAKSGHDVRPAAVWPHQSAHADSLIRSPPVVSEAPSPRSAAGPPPEADPGALAGAGFSCQSVPRFSRAHITRTR